MSDKQTVNVGTIDSSAMLSLPALSIRQPWAWLILNAGKDIENRNWRASFRGRFLIHSAKGMTRMEYEECAMFLTTDIPRGITLPPFETLERGGIVGEAEITGCWVKHQSPWFVGFYGFSLANVKPLPFQPCRGALGFFRPNAKGHPENCS
jgi:hypothetical protein